MRGPPHIPFNGIQRIPNHQPENLVRKISSGPSSRLATIIIRRRDLDYIRTDDIQRSQLAQDSLQLPRGPAAWFGAPCPWGEAGFYIVLDNI